MTSIRRRQALESHVGEHDTNVTPAEGLVSDGWTPRWPVSRHRDTTGTSACPGATTCARRLVSAGRDRAGVSVRRLVVERAGRHVRRVVVARTVLVNRCLAASVVSTCTVTVRMTEELAAGVGNTAPPLRLLKFHVTVPAVTPEPIVHGVGVAGQETAVSSSGNVSTTVTPVAA